MSVTVERGHLLLKPVEGSSGAPLRIRGVDMHLMVGRDCRGKHLSKNGSRQDPHPTRRNLVYGLAEIAEPA